MGLSPHWSTSRSLFFFLGLSLVLDCSRLVGVDSPHWSTSRSPFFFLCLSLGPCCSCRFCPLGWSAFDSLALNSTSLLKAVVSYGTACVRACPSLPSAQSSSLLPRVISRGSAFKRGHLLRLFLELFSNLSLE